VTAAPAGVEFLFRQHAGEVLGTLMRRFGDLDLAEEALQDALVEALTRWPREGEPANRVAWLVTVSRAKAIDRLRRGGRRPELELSAGGSVPGGFDPWDTAVDPVTSVDDQLALILLCCHPALAVEAQIALTLRAVAGLSTATIARGFMVPASTMAQRLVRAKARIRDAGIPFGLPDRAALGRRLDVVMHVLYLVFNSGYAGTDAGGYLRPELCGEAIRLARSLSVLAPHEPEVLGLLALMLLHDGRAPGRIGPDGELRTLEQQDRSSWRHEQIVEGTGLVDRAMELHGPGRYQIEAAIAALHSSAPTAAATDWRQIDALYTALRRRVPTSVVALNAAVARGMASGPEAGLALIEECGLAESLRDWHLFHAATADLLDRAGRREPALGAVRRAIELAPTDAERRHLERREREMAG